jgi:NAD(P)-dependent dehydrogenase (short-subunit alcohol dehydrogenase family)
MSPVAVVTGAASGVGAASARRLARDGASVVVADIDEDGGRRVAEEVGGRFARLDVGDQDAWLALADELRGGAGVELAHLNAGILAASDAVPFLDTPIARYHAMVGVNLDGVVLGVHALAPVMIERGGGSIAVTASLAGLIPYGGDPIYAATKHGVVGFVRSVAPQLGRQRVRVHAICPSGIDTPMVAGARVEAGRESGATFMPPEAVADAVADLLERDDHGRVQLISQRLGVEDVPSPRHDT